MLELFFSTLLVALVILFGQVHHVVLVHVVHTVYFVLVSAVHQVHPVKRVIAVSSQEDLIEELRVQLNNKFFVLRQRVFKLDLRVHQAEAEDLDWKFFAR